MAANNQTLGRGKVYFSKFKTGTYTPEGYRYLGNTPSFNLSIAQSKLDHYSSDAGIRVKDKSIILQTDFTGNLTCDDIDYDNLALFFLGSTSTLAQTSATSQSETFTSVIQGASYQIGVNDSNPTGVRSLSNVVVTVSASAKTLGTDYTIDAARGILTIVSGGGIASGVTVTVSYDRAAKSRKQVISGTSQVEGSVMFVSANPEGDLIDYVMPYVRIGPNGDFALKSDEWQTLPLTVEILTAPNRQAIYLDGQVFTP